MVREPAECLWLLGDVYKRKWKADDAQRVENLNEFANQLGWDPITISHVAVRQALTKLKTEVFWMFMGFVRKPLNYFSWHAQMSCAHGGKLF